MGATLDMHRDGLSLAELRDQLCVATEPLRIALDAALRKRFVRRTGSHNTLRYLANPHD